MKVVAEVAQAHDGSLGTALAYVKAIAAAGADVAKFQDHLGDSCNRFRPGTDFPQDKSRRDYWLRTNFDPQHWWQIRQACKDHGLEYIVSCFSMRAFERQAELEPDRWKIGSSKVNDHELIDACVKTGKPVIVSSGMSTWEELEWSVVRVPEPQRTVLHCITAYPAKPSQIGLSCLWREAFDGISDHSGTIWPSIFAASVPCDMAEVHVVFSRDCFGPDVSASITIDELRQLVAGVRFIEAAMQGSREEAIESVKEMREVFSVA
jgi:N,N'-diacetyllegionaminate synthase